MDKNYLDSLVGVFGHPVAENPTVVMIEAGFLAAGLEKWRYLTIDVTPDKLQQAMQALRILGFKGINLTMPHKVEVLPFLDEISEAAEKIGAVNTVVHRDGKLFGENTDGKGFVSGLQKDAGLDLAGGKVTVLGAGGAARAICVELALAGAARITIANRTLKKAEALGDRIRGRTGVASEAVELVPGYAVPGDTDIVVQATSIGLYPDTDKRPDINYDSITEKMTVCDVIPNLPNTIFLSEAAKRGSVTLDGLSMLVHQGVIGFKLWTGVDAPADAMKAALKKEFGVV